MLPPCTSCPVPAEISSVLGSQGSDDWCLRSPEVDGLLPPRTLLKVGCLPGPILGLGAGEQPVSLGLSSAWGHEMCVGSATMALCAPLCTSCISAPWIPGAGLSGGQTDTKYMLQCVSLVRVVHHVMLQSIAEVSPASLGNGFQGRGHCTIAAVTAERALHDTPARG